jgi:hypothetical protein
MHFHNEEFGEGPEEGRDEFRTLVARNMTRNTMFGKDVNEEEPGETSRCNMNVAGN